MPGRAGLDGNYYWRICLGVTPSMRLKCRVRWLGPQSDRGRNLGQGTVAGAGAKQCAGAVHPHLQEVLVRRDAGCFLEDPGQMKRAQMCRRRNIRQAQVPVVVVVNEIDGLGHRPRLR